MTKFERVQDYFERRLWNVERVKNAVRMGWITKAEYCVIVGVEFCEDIH